MKSFTNSKAISISKDTTGTEEQSWPELFTHRLRMQSRAPLLGDLITCYRLS